MSLAGDTAHVYFTDGTTRIVLLTNMHTMQYPSIRTAYALVDNQEIPVSNCVEWGFLWCEQEVFMAVSTNECLE